MVGDVAGGVRRDVEHLEVEAKFRHGHARAFVELGLVYEVEIAEKDVYVKMTMTSQACPVGPQLLDGVKRNIEMRVPGVRTSNVTLVFEPPWSPEMMTPDARKSMGW